MRQADPVGRSNDEASTEARREPARLPIWPALLAVYVIWGSTYLAIRIAVHGFPPFLMSGIRFTLAGAVLFTVLRLHGAPSPTLRQWIGMTVVGALLLCGGNGGVAYAEQYVSSSIAAIAIGSVPLWAAVFTGVTGHWPARTEVVGLVLGFAGVALLNFGGPIRGHPVYAIILVLAAVSWALGSVWSRSLSLPSGLLASAGQMLAGGVVLIVVGALRGERIPGAIPASSLWAMAYLAACGSLVAFTAYNFLLQRARPAVATSYAYVNPGVAVLLGVGLAGEHITGIEIVALVVILFGVALVILGRASLRAR